MYLQLRGTCDGLIKILLYVGECVEIYLCTDFVYPLQYICSADMTAQVAAFYT